ncbi:MAG: 3-hydroxybutyryl-CoA dehydrogenase [Rubritepida sp.]|nr:3-hydroxybutyryl-CoA dehydrogenase [Rubritepida sp.]
MAEGICVIGGGMMGMGILRGFAGHGIPLSLITRDPSAPKPGLPEGTRLLAGFEGEAPALLIESVPEDMAVKRDVLARAEAAWGGKTLIASNTSVLPLQEIADGLAYPESFLGLHYMHPADRWAYVEMIAAVQTDPAALEAVAALLARAGKTALRLMKPIPGALINRLQHAMAREAYHLMAEGVADAATIDLVVRRMLAPRMSVTGLIEQKDLSGLVTHAASQGGLNRHLHNGDTAQPFLVALPARGETGADSGLGFYDWRNTDPTAFREFAAGYVTRILAIVEEAEAERPGLAPAPRKH